MKLRWDRAFYLTRPAEDLVWTILQETANMLGGPGARQS